LTISYGTQLLPGEGNAIAQFVKEKKRVPRRGEIGWTSEQIEKFEGAGFVMSGSRNKKMTAVRVIKESAVISAEEQRIMSLAALQERVERENKIIADFRQIINSKLTSNKPG